MLGSLNGKEKSMQKIIDGHVWTRNDSGIYTPDTEYYVDSDVWCCGEDYDDITFMVVHDDKGILVKMMIVGFEGLKEIHEEKDSMRAMGINAEIIVACGAGMEIGGLF